MNDLPVADLVVDGASEIVTCAGPWPAAGPDQSRVGVVEEGAIAAHNGIITWVGPEWRLGRSVRRLPGATQIDAGGRVVLPGFVDAHTHLVYAGDRADEFEHRLAGKSYSDIAAAGGGILRTVEATRAATLEELVGLAAARLDRLMHNGATAVEIKSGYGLTHDDELKILEAARAVGRGRAQEIVTTFLGAHTLPREARGSSAARAAYVEMLCSDLIPEVAQRQLARFVDVYVDQHAFTLDEARRVLTTGREHGLGVKVHADQMADDGAAALAAELGATSAEHLDHVSDRALTALAAARTIAVLLPAASLFLRAARHADGRRMIEHGVPVALATDLNPGTCPCESLPLVIQLACLICGLQVDEAIVAATLNAAAAIGIADRAGSIEPGKRCDLVVLDAAERRQLVYQLGSARLHMVIANGRIVG